MAEYRFSETPTTHGEVRLEWTKDDCPPDPLDFWIIDSAELEQAKARVLAGEFDG